MAGGERNRAADRTGGSLLACGVYRAPSLSATGQLAYFAVDHYHIEVARVELGARDDDEKIVAHLGPILDAVDPEQARPRRPKITA
jgi:hypothetical protein